MKNISGRILFIILIGSIALTGCKSSKHKSKPFAELAKQDEILLKENASLKKETDSLFTVAGQFKPDSLDMGPDVDSSIVEELNIIYYRISVAKEKMEELAAVLRKAQADVFFTADNMRPGAKDSMTLKGLKHPDESELVIHYFYGDNVNYKIAAAHNIKEEIDLFKLALKLSRDTLKIKPADTLWLSIRDTAHDAEGKLLPWEANFDDHTAAEDYIFFDKLKNEALREYQATLLILLKQMISLSDEVGPQGGC
jgi:hypothetical protein